MTPAAERDQAPICPWCSAALPAIDAAACPSCEARLIEPADIVIPGVTAVDPVLLAAAAAPRKVKRTFGSLLVGDDNEIPPPSEAEMPALARPDADVRREILRLEMEARLVALKAEVAARSADGAVAAGPPPEPPDTGERPGTAERPDGGDVLDTGERPGTAERPDGGDVPDTGERPDTEGPPDGA